MPEDLHIQACPEEPKWLCHTWHAQPTLMRQQQGAVHAKPSC